MEAYTEAREQSWLRIHNGCFNHRVMDEAQPKDVLGRELALQVG